MCILAGALRVLELAALVRTVSFDGLNGVFQAVTGHVIQYYTLTCTPFVNLHVNGTEHVSCMTLLRQPQQPINKERKQVGRFLVFSCSVSFCSLAVILSYYFPLPWFHCRPLDL